MGLFALADPDTVELARYGYNRPELYHAGELRDDHLRYVVPSNYTCVRGGRAAAYRVGDSFGGSIGPSEL